MASKFTQLNRFVQASNGVFHIGTDESEREFNYSDGAASELYLRDVLSQAQDISSDSSELEEKIIDWPSEYHLSSARANLLRPIKLNGLENVLELGSGCGSITRYLAEASNAQIDAVEGSPIRADLAALRCRDQANVTISTANFNGVEFPANHYDLILFVGVTEYAGRFSERETDQEALQDLLALAANALKPNGVVLIAIENRIGLKYLHGACEDHYGVPYLGVNDYPESSGIRTYTRDEWRAQISQAGFSASQFLYPFPDYKIPTLVVNREGAEATSAALSKIQSRDYVAPFDLGENETILWDEKIAAGTLGEHANSFLILLSDTQSVLSKMADFELAEYPQVAMPYLQSAAVEEPVSEPEVPAQEFVTKGLLSRLAKKIGLIQ